MNIQKRPVPPVTWDQLRKALPLFYAWAEAGSEDDDSETIAPSDLHGLLDRLVQTIGVSDDLAIAIFQRAVALSAFCADENLSNELFENGLPGRELCMAASKIDVLDVPGDENGEISHTFDKEDMRAALLAARN